MAKTTGLSQRRAVAAAGCILALAGCGGTSSPRQLTIHWDRITLVNKTTPTLQVVVNPRLRPGQALGSGAYKALAALGADYVRYQLWFPYPKLAVAELQPPAPERTSWDFSLIDPMIDEFLKATDGHPTVVDFSTIPQWMFVTNAPVAYPSDPTQVTWDYEQGTELRDPSGTELADYYERLASWWENGGFTDENGLWHGSGHHYRFPVWEVLNEPNFEHSTTPEEYTRRYDAIVQAVGRVSPDTKFMGLALGAPAGDLDFLRYFLNASNHLPEIPIDWISYHFYAVPDLGESIADWQYTLFEQADEFVDTVGSIEQIRKQLASQTRTDIDELGSILPTDAPPAIGVAPPAAYWNLSAAMYAYMYVKLARMQIDVVGESQLVGFPTQYPTVSMMDWMSNQPNARFWVVKLLKDSFHPGDKMVETDVSLPTGFDVEAQGFVTTEGRKLLLVNKRNRAVDVALPERANVTALTVDAQSGEGPARSIVVEGGAMTLQPFAVAVVSWK